MFYLQCVVVEDGNGSFQHSYGLVNVNARERTLSRFCENKFV
jgi:hypothetical protein